ncbi:PAS domain-containing protein [Chthonobacter albigriseus]|uniref:PAS domain-containing protein n=1 Tax=Chthonobacter albigriseus TaxID=1683161 RepID=UPI0015EF5DE3|nr:PAS domain-containing protein [Chthonobacter albigriseus]
MWDRAYSVPLPADLRAFVDGEVAAGRFSGPEEVIRAALRQFAATAPDGGIRSMGTDAAVLDGIGDGYFAVDFGWRITAFNAAAELYFRWPRAEVIGRVLWNVIPAFAGTDFERRYRRAMDERRPDAFASPSAVRPGVWVDIRAFPIPEGLGIAFRDITEHRRMMEALRANEERLRFALDASEMGDWSWDAATDVVTFSAAGAEMFGLDDLSTTWTDLQRDHLVQEDAEQARAMVETAIATRGRYAAEYRVRLPDGTIRWIAAKGRGTYDEVGAAIGMQGLVQDITAGKDAERRLQESEARLEIATRTHRIGIFDWHIPSGRVVWSDEEQRIFGMVPGDFEGTIGDWARRVHPEDRKPSEERLTTAMENRESAIDFSFRIIRPDGVVRWIEGSGRFLYDAEGHPVQLIGVNIDVTERVRHIADLERADRHLRLLVNELNHRVKNTLASVQSIAAQTLRPGVEVAEAREAFAARLVALAGAHDVLTRENWEGADLRDVVAGAIGPFEARKGERFHLEGPEARLPPKLAVTLAMALHELCTNAVKYGALSTDAGCVSITWTVAEDRGGSTLALTWTERGGPVVTLPTHRGFGTRLIEKGLTFDVGGSVDLSFDPTGVVCRIRTQLQQEGASIVA